MLELHETERSIEQNNAQHDEDTNRRRHEGQEPRDRRLVPVARDPDQRGDRALALLALVAGEDRRRELAREVVVDGVERGVRIDRPADGLVEQIEDAVQRTARLVYDRTTCDAVLVYRREHTRLHVLGSWPEVPAVKGKAASGLALAALGRAEVSYRLDAEADPATQAELYRRAVDLLLGRWTRRRSQPACPASVNGRCGRAIGRAAVRRCRRRRSAIGRAAPQPRFGLACA